MKSFVGILNIVSIVGLGLYLGLIYMMNAGGAQTDTKIQDKTCKVVTVPYEVQNVDSPLLNIGKTEVSKVGINGSRHVCKDANQTVISDNLVSEPITKVINVGTKQPEPVYTPVVEEEEESGGGAICNDGWRSYSVGRGTCSSHGGINYYL